MYDCLPPALYQGLTTSRPALPPALHYWQPCTRVLPALHYRQALGKALRLQLQISAMRAAGHADSPGVLEILSGASHALLGPGGLVRSRITRTLILTRTLTLTLNPTTLALHPP